MNSFHVNDPVFWKYITLTSNLPRLMGDPPKIGRADIQGIFADGTSFELPKAFVSSVRYHANPDLDLAEVHIYFLNRMEPLRCQIDALATTSANQTWYFYGSATTLDSSGIRYLAAQPDEAMLFKLRRTENGSTCEAGDILWEEIDRLLKGPLPRDISKPLAPYDFAVHRFRRVNGRVDGGEIHASPSPTHLYFSERNEEAYLRHILETASRYRKVDQGLITEDTL